MQSNKPTGMMKPYDNTKLDNYLYNNPKDTFMDVEKKADEENDSEQITIFALSETRRITVKKFKGKKIVDIRDYYKAYDGEYKPTKKGICLSAEHWEKLRFNIDLIDKAFKDIK